MPLRLKSLELHGYKTFAAKIDFLFDEGITAIVGPNGSGKSNIADALRWVLGEQSYSLLRAKKTEDMIFAGSEQRPRSGMASVTVVFDNSAGWLPVDFSEVALTRRAYRDGHNEYLLNSQQVRLKDINELLAHSGLSERTYTILGQGLVDASLALRADERRRLFEEAAGIGLYRARREETLRRLETTQRNLERALDILSELEPRLKSLERQAKRAQEYIQMQADLRLLLRDWYGYHWHRSQSELTQARETTYMQEAKLHDARETYQAIRSNYAAFRDRLQTLRGQLNFWHRQSAQLHDNHETISRNLAVFDERRRALSDNHQNILSEQSRLTEELHVAGERLTETDADVIRLKAEYDESQSQVKAAQAALEARLVNKMQAEVDLQSARSKLDELSARRAQLQAHQDELHSRTEGQKQKLDSTVQSITISEANVQKTDAEYQHTSSVCKQAEAELQKTEAELQKFQKHLAALEESHKEQQAKRVTREAERVKLKAQLDVLEQAEQSLSGYAEGAKLLLDAARQSRLSGTRGALSAALDVPAELEVAIAAALGEYTDAVLLESGRNAEQALSLLDSDQSGRVSLLPLDWLSSSKPLRTPHDSDCLGIAADLIKVPEELRPAVDLLLGYTLVVRDRKVARRVLADQSGSVRVVTLRGEVFIASGPVLAGKPARAIVLGRPRQRREMQEALTEVERQVTSLNASVQKLEKEKTNVQDEVSAQESKMREKRSRLDSVLAAERQAQVQAESALRQRDWQISQQENLKIEIAQAETEHEKAAAAFSQSEGEIAHTQEDIRARNAALASLTMDECQSQVTYWGTRLAVSEHALGDAQARQEERQLSAGHMQEQQSTLENRLAEVERSLASLDSEKETLRGQEGRLNAELEELRGLIEPAEKELETAEIQEVELQKQEMDGQQALARVERHYNQVQLDMGRKQEALDMLRKKIEDDFGLVAFEYPADVSGPVPLPFEGMVEQLPAVVELQPDLEENMTRQRALLRRIGPVNMEAQQEHESVRERYEFLNTQIDDLHKAEADLRQVIAELDELTKVKFHKTFSAVAEEFHTIFHRLFGGGSARLMLTDSENLTETGIDIEARLPGRREQGLALLSGGERSLTAIALVFALLKVSPTPVCVMDEVDAMLDEANVARFRELLTELSKDTQFVIVTHNRNTVQAADVIYGVTMGRDSTSQVISLKLDEITEDYVK